MQYVGMLKSDIIEPDIVFCDDDFCGTSIIKVVCPHCDTIFYQRQQCGELYILWKLRFKRC